ncbi:GNAT family N-acetyltransferase [Rheinheimera metallidurans]|uniref:GNAT family N-acetyltransferase n=1 Tax=Rheinheimera metallidurans TaxID=2925781 RepID=UPI0030021E2B
MPNMPPLQQLRQWQRQAAAHHIRLPIVWQGEQQQLLMNALQLVDNADINTLYWIGDAAPDNAINLSSKQNYQLLGSECDALIINAFSGFPADLIAASMGCVKAGGIWLLLCPPLTQWQAQPNPAHKNVLPYPLDAKLHVGQFLPFWLQQLAQQNIVMLQNNEDTQQLNWPALPEPEQITAPYITGEQQQAVMAILRVVSGHRRRPLVITADRGRGKSAALGIAAAQLASAGKTIVITAPSPAAAQTALSHFQQLCNAEDYSRLQFVAFDQLLSSNLDTDLLLIDEAAAIPTPVLQQLVARYSRIVFATTEHGYEGTGRGFQLRFQQHLDAHCPGWKKLHLQQPIRYQTADPLEQLSFNSFLLKHADNDVSYDSTQPVSVNSYSNNDWQTQPELLQQVFSLLSLAHYQTQVKDLAALLDNPHLRVITLQQHSQLLACALISIEGNLESELCTHIYHAERRVQGHLLAQSLAFHLAQPQLATLPLWRVMRITVQPVLQRQKLGSVLLQHIYQQAKLANIAYLGTSFGLTTELLHFWHQAKYQPIRLGQSSDKASAEYSILMLRAVKGSTDKVTELYQQFSLQLYWALPHYPQLSCELALTLAQPPQQLALNNADLQQLALFSQGKRPYELVRHLMLQWFNQQQPIDVKTQLMLCGLLWQQLGWTTLLLRFALPNKKVFIEHIAANLKAALAETSS